MHFPSREVWAAPRAVRGDLVRDAAGSCEFLSIGDLLKASAVEEGGARFIFLEASNEARDFQGETVLAKALAESAEYYNRYGNIDLDHITVFGPKAGIVDYAAFEIGRPVQVRVAGRDTFVKAQIFTGTGPMADNANRFWQSITQLHPPQRWFPSVGGAVMARDTRRDPKTGSPHTIVTKVRWTNIGMSKTPVNPSVPEVSTVAIGPLAKSWTGSGWDLTKALEAGHAVSPADMTGGAALRRQSLEGASRRRVGSYWEFRDCVAGDLRKGACGSSAEAITDHAHRSYGLDPAEAADWTGRFLADLRDGLQKRTNR